ncbi:probable CCR4-associated factor 1 homolog 11 [Gossypium hirsutum]|uniref:poly(A)-specific ribonuclease n=1 Tax=Gossypium hirsutum TaxID=3635 RepID=A0A1U8JP92_GOSHI|nr:probable CCR4-associated factor 1 homolog 11 [Gossypium hirsutum]
MSISSNKSIVVRRVFAEDLDNELWLIKVAILRYPYVFMDTEFPGTIFKPSKQVVFEENPVINYHYMKSNVDALQIIQLGLSLSDAQGNLPDFDSPFCYVWEFNFKDFNINRDHYASTSIELLKRQGIDFEKNKEKGIDSRDFAKKLWDYGLVFNCYGLNGITWITFHGAYDFGFMLKMLTQSPLPLDLHSFVHQLAYFFGYNVFDLKHTFKLLGLLGGLEKIAQTLKLKGAEETGDNLCLEQLKEFGSVVNDAGNQDAQNVENSENRSLKEDKSTPVWDQKTSSSNHADQNAEISLPQEKMTSASPNCLSTDKQHSQQQQ